MFLPRIPFKLQYASNLFAYTNPRAAIKALKPRAAPALALLGNCFNTETRQTRAATKKFLQHCDATWDRTLILLGPTEYASAKPRNFVDAREELRELAADCSTRSVIEVLDQTETSIGRSGVRILGVSGWSTIPVFPPKLRPLEFEAIWHARGGNLQPFGPADVQDLHLSDIAWLKETVESSLDPAVILSHSLPSNLLMTTGLPAQAYWRAALDNLSYTHHTAMTPEVKAWLGGATGSCATGTLRHMFIAVNSWKSFPEQETPNPKFQSDAVLTLQPPPIWPGGGLDRVAAFIRQPRAGPAPVLAQM